MTRRQIAWILVLIVDAGLVVWGAMAAAWPDHLLGPSGVPILQAGYEGFSNGSWSALASTSPMTARYIELLFRMYGVFNVAFGLMMRRTPAAEIRARVARASSSRCCRSSSSACAR